MDSEIQIDGNTKELVGLLSVTVVIPTGSSDSRSWVTDLLTGKLQIWPGSYVTLGPVGPFAEITPAARDNILVKAIGIGVALDGAGDHHDWSVCSTSNTGAGSGRN